MRSALPFARRTASVALVALLGAATVFVAMRAGPGDPALSALGEHATPDAVEAFRRRWGLDAPLAVQFWRWLVSVAGGEFGQSMAVASGVSIGDLIATRLPNTLFVGLYATTLALIISLAAGTIAALWRGRSGDTLATSLAVLGISMPDFWIAYILIYGLALGAGLFPAYGFIPPQVSLSGALHSATLPAVAVAAPMAATFTRILRTSLIENLNRDHVRVARSLGQGARFIFLHHVLRNALIPFVTVVGLQIRYLLGGTVVIERIFGIPGLGSLMVDAAFARDYPVVQACALVFLLGVLLANAITDAVCTALDPRRT